MFRPGPSILTLTVALAGAADAPSPDPLDIIHSGSYSTNVSATPTARILNWNIDRGQHFKGVVAAMRETHPDVCIFQEVDLGAAAPKAKTWPRNWPGLLG